MNMPYTTKEELLENWLSPEDVEKLGLSDLKKAKAKGKAWKKVYEELDTLPRCAQHGTVSKTFLFYIVVHLVCILKVVLLFCSGILMLLFCSGTPKSTNCAGVMVVMRNMTVL